MKAITASDQAAGAAGLELSEVDRPRATVNDVIVRVRAAGSTPGELTWPSSWFDRAGHDRSPSIIGHDVAGTVEEIGWGASGFEIGQRVFGLADFTRNGTLAEFVAVEARNLAALPDDVDFATASTLPVSGLTAWQALFDHGRLVSGQTVLIQGVAGGVSSIATQLAREAGAHVIGTGRAGDRVRAMELGMERFIDVDADDLSSVDAVDLVFDLFGGDQLAEYASLIRPGGTLVSIAGPTDIRPKDGRTVFFVVVADRAQLSALAERVSDGRLNIGIGAQVPLDDAVAAFQPETRPRGRAVFIVDEK